MKSESTSTARGFSLFEVLIVVTIIAILVALIFPVFGKAKRTAKSISCLSNLRQIGAATIMYGTDNDGRLPPMNPLTGVSWDGKSENPLLVYGATPDVFHCPDVGRERDFDVRTDFIVRFAFRKSGPKVDEFFPIIPVDSSVIVYCEWNMNVQNVTPSTAEKRTANGSYNVLRFDGSVARILTERTVTHLEDWGGFGPEFRPDEYRWIEFPDEPFPPMLERPAPRPP